MLESHKEKQQYRHQGLECEDAGITQGEAAISASRVEGEDAGITHGQAPDMAKKDMGQNTVAEKAKTSEMAGSYDVALIYDERMLEHAPPEGDIVDDMPERLSSIMQKLINEGLANR